MLKCTAFALLALVDVANMQCLLAQIVRKTRRPPVRPSARPPVRPSVPSLAQLLCMAQDQIPDALSDQVIVTSSLLHFTFKPYVSGALSQLDYFYSICLLAFTLFGMAFSQFTVYDPDDATIIVREGRFPPQLNWLKDYLDLISVSCVLLAAVITFSDMLKELFKKYRCFLISFDCPLIAF